MALREVANLAGVSVSTVSRCFSGGPGVSVQTTDVISQAARELGLRTPPRRKSRTPASRARALLVSTSGFHDGHDGWGTRFGELLRGVVAAADACALKLVLNVGSAEGRTARKAGGWAFDGMIAFDDVPAASGAGQACTIPTVRLLPNGRRVAAGDEVMPDHGAIGETAARAFLACGHRRLAYVTTTADPWFSRLQFFSFRRAAEDRGATVEAIPVSAAAAAASICSSEGMRRAAAGLLSGRGGPTALFVADASLVPLCQAAIQHREFDVGASRDMHLILSGDGVLPAADHAPPVARVGTSPRALGQRAVEQLLWRINNPDVPERVRLMVEPALVEAEQQGFSLGRGDAADGRAVSEGQWTLALV